MAVVSISRIQIRRGKKNSGTGLPQLASGELAWAIDTQELFIGNGSVSEGAPAVGNTKILTDKDNIFDYANFYSYRLGNIQTGSTSSNPVFRTLQERLDDRVSIRSFGAAGDNTVQTEAIQRALYQLFLNSDKSSPQSRYTLYIEPGEYIVDSTIYVPPYTTIVGAGKEKTIIKFTGTGSLFKTINSLSTLTVLGNELLTDGTNQPRYLNISGITITIPVDTIALELNNCRDSLFEDLEFLSDWESSSSSAGVAIKFNGVVSCKNNKFNRIKFKNISQAVEADYDTADNTWSDCEFENLGIGLVFGLHTTLPGSAVPVGNVVENSLFRNINRQAVHVIKGKQNRSVANKYYSVGNDGGTDQNAAYPVLQFDDSPNISESDWFERSKQLGSNPSFINVAYVPEVKGKSIYQNQFENHISIGQLTNPALKLRLPAEQYRVFEIEYLYKSATISAKRQGVLEITADPDFNQKIVSDNYDYIGNTAFRENFDFIVDFRDDNGDSLLDTIGISIVNSTSNDNAEFYYRVKTKS